MISEIDIRDWEVIDFKEIKGLLDDRPKSLDDDLYQWSIDVEDICREFIEHMELLRDKQVQLATKHVAAVEKAFKE